MEDDYQKMAPNPRHLLVLHDQGGSPIRDISHQDQRSKDLTQDGASGGLDKPSTELTRSEDHDILSCKNRLLFMKNKHKEYSARVLELYTISPDCVRALNTWLNETLLAMENTCKDAPICTKVQMINAHDELTFLKDLARSFDEIPGTLQKMLPETTEVKDKFLDYINEDLMTLQGVCYNRIEITRGYMKSYEIALKKLSQRRMTRSLEQILDGTEPIPLDLLEPDSPAYGGNHIYSTIEESNEPTPDPLDSPSNIISDINKHNKADCQNTSISELPTNARDDSSRLETIIEEPLTEEQRAHLASLVKEIIGQDSLDDFDLDDPSVALGLLQDRLGVSLDVNEANIMDKVATICKSKRMFKSILSNPNQESPKVLTSTPGAGDLLPLPARPPSTHTPHAVEYDERCPTPLFGSMSTSTDSSSFQTGWSQAKGTPATPSECGDNKFYTPGTTDPMGFYSIYHTAQGGVQSTVSLDELQTPSRPGIITQRSLVETMNLSPMIGGLHMNAPDPSLAQNTQGIGPNLDSRTTQEDLDRHQRAILFPPVKERVQHRELSPEDLDLPLLNNMTIEDQRNYIGDHIHPFVTSKDPKNANKITGMIIDLPMNELIPGVKSPHVLSRMINEAQVLLEPGDEYESNPHVTLSLSTSPQYDRSVQSQESKIEGDGSKVEAQYNTNSPHNDYQSAMFQEMYLTPSCQGDNQPQVNVTPSYQGNARMSTPTQSTPYPSMYCGPPFSQQVKVTEPIYVNIPKIHQPAYGVDINAKRSNPAQHEPQRSFVYEHRNKSHAVLTQEMKVPAQRFDARALQTVSRNQTQPMTGQYQYNVHGTPGKVQPGYGQSSFLGGNPQRQISDEKFKQGPSMQGANTHAFWMHTHMPIHHNQRQTGPLHLPGATPRYPSMNIGGTQPVSNTYQYTNSHIPQAPPSMSVPNFQSRPLGNQGGNSNPGVIELVLRERKELRSTSFLVQRIVGQLSMAPQMNSQELTDLLSNMKEYGRSLEKLEDKVSKFLKCLIKNRDVIDRHDHSLYSHMKQEIDEAEALSFELQSKLNEADLIIGTERITLSHSTANSKDLSYKEFSAGRGMHDAHIYEFLTSLETNFRISRTPENMKSQVLKDKLRGLAKLAISDDLNDFRQICAILLHKFGNPIEILSHILDLHQEVGKIPSKYCQRPPWQKIEDVCKSHLQLIRKAESLSKDPRAWPQIFENSFRNFHLINLISHEWNDDLKSQRDNIDPGEMYRLIVNRFESILTSAASNIEFTETKQRKEREIRRPDDKVDMDQFALSYGERRTREITVGNCQPQDCHFCTTFQKLGRGRDYFEKHILYGPSKRNYVNNCPNYLSLSLEDKNSFVYSNNFCPYCLRPKSQCKNQACGDDHLIPYANGKKKNYVCLEPTCRHRIELCLVHKEKNMETIETRKRGLTERFNIDLTVGAFTAMHSQTYYSDGDTANIADNKSEEEDDVTRLSIESNPSSIEKLNSSSNQSHESDAQISREPSKISREYMAYKKGWSNKTEPSGDKSILFVPQNSKKIRNGQNPHKQVNDLDQPLLVESTSELLKNGTRLLAGDCKSIFIYSKIQGLTRPITVLFDSGGGSSLTLSNVPGRQLPACKGKSGPICLQGIGSGRTTGEQYTMQLPLLGGGKVAVEIYSVPEILQPMSKVDLEPALQFFKESSRNDPDLDEKTKSEISRASIFRFVQGSLDLLLGVKLLSIFPKLIHTLNCGLSIFKMRLKPSSSAIYCLGGPYQSLSSLQAIFPDGALMLQEIDSYLNDWRESAHDLTHEHSLLSDPSGLVYEINTASESSLEYANASTDEIILSIGSNDNQDCDCGKPLMNENDIVICCNRRSAMINKLKAVFFCGRHPYPIEHSDSRPYNRVDWLEDMNDVLMNYQSHLSTCSIKHSKGIIKPCNNSVAPCGMREEMGSLFRRYEDNFDLSQSMQFLKSAMCHLDTCMPTEPMSNETQRPNTFIAFRCDEKFSKELKTFQDFFLTFYPEFKQAMVPADSSHITVLAFKLPSEDHLQKAGLAFAAAWNKWLNKFPFQSIGSMCMSFTGTGMFDDKVLYLKPAMFNKALISLHSMLLTEFEHYGFECDQRMTPHLTFAKLKPNSEQSFPRDCSTVFSEVAAGNTRFHKIEMLSMKKTITKEFPCFKALTFSKDLTLPKPDPKDKKMDWSLITDNPRRNNSTILTVENSDITLGPILTFQPSDENEQEMRVPEDSTVDNSQEVVQKFRQAWNNTLDAFTKNDINTTMKYMYDNDLSSKCSQNVISSNQHDNEYQWNGYDSGTLADDTNQNLAIFNLELPDTDLQLFEIPNQYQPSKMSEFELDLRILAIKNKQQTIEDFEFTDADLRLFAIPDQHPRVDLDATTDNAKKNETNVDLKPERVKPAKEFNYLLSLLEQILQTNNPEPRCSDCIGCKSCKDLSVACSTNIESSLHREEFIIKSSIQFDKSRKKFCVPLPLKEDPSESLANNSKQSRKIYDRITESLDKHPDDKSAILKSFNKQVELGFIQKLSSLDQDLQKSIMSKQRYVIPWNVVHKASSISTPVRIVLNASSKTKTGKSLNSILCKGAPKINMLPLVMILLSDPILLTLDLMKFYNSCLIPESQYHLQCIWWEENLDINEEPELYILKTHTYGVVSSGRVLELCLEQVAEMHSENKPFHDLFLRKLYVDDGFANCKSVHDAEKLKEDCERILPAYGFKAKGYAESFKVPPSDISEEVDGVRTVGTIGLIWIPQKDVLKLRPPTLDFTGIKHRGKLIHGNLFSGTTFQELNGFVPRIITLRMVASKAACFWDPAGLAEAWYLGVKHILRLSTEAVSRAWDDPLPEYLRDIWVQKFWEMIELSKVEFPRCAFPLGVTYTRLIIVSLSDMGLIGKLQCFYSLKEISEDNYHVQLIYSKSQLSDKRSVPNQELDSLNSSSITLDKICHCLGNVDRRAMLMDSTVCAYWLMKNPVKLGVFQRLRVQNILRHCDKEDIFHIRSSWNSSDIGTKKPEPISSVLPGSFFSKGPQILQYGIDGCVRRSYIKAIGEVVLNPSVRNVALNGFTHKDMPQGYFETDVPSVSDNNKQIAAFADSLQQETLPPKTMDQRVPTEHEVLIDPEHSVMCHNQVFIKKVQERFEFHQYLVNPIERPWSISVRTMSIALHFIRQILLKRLQSKNSAFTNTWERVNRHMFCTEYEPILQECFTNLCFSVDEGSDVQLEETHHCSSQDCSSVLSHRESHVNPDFQLKTIAQPLSYADMFNSIHSMKLARESAILYYLRLASTEL